MAPLFLKFFRPFSGVDSI